MAASDELGDFLQDLADKAREFGAQREEKFNQVLELLRDLFGLPGKEDSDES